MLALITGASSGLGRDMALELSQRGYDLILVARREDRLLELAKNVKGLAITLKADISTEMGVKMIRETVGDQKIDVWVNNAGFGLFGRFDEEKLDDELEMIELNIGAFHRMMKMAVEKMSKRGGFILNVASSAAFMPGPMMGCYYATKAYVLRLSEAVGEELRASGSTLSVSVLCPGPVETEFNRRAGVTFSMKGLKSKDVAAYAIKQTFRKKRVIVPGFLMKITRVLVTLLPNPWILPIVYRFSHSLTEPNKV